MSVASNDKIKGLFNWCVNQTKGYKNVSITNFSSSWKNGLGFCAILHRYGPDLIDFFNLSPENILENCELAFNVAEKHFGIPALLCPKDMVILKSPDRLCMITYLSQYYNTFASKTPVYLNDETGLLSSIENIEKETKSKDKQKINDEEIENIPIVIGEQSDNQICAICSEAIYFLEKLTVSDIIYHRSCYRQNQLNNLKIRNKTLERPTKDLTEQTRDLNTKPDEILNKSIDKSSHSRPTQVITSEVIRSSISRDISLDSYKSENNLINDDNLKSVENRFEDHSSVSASPINHISVNASSMESLSQHNSELSARGDKDVKTTLNKLHSNSLFNSNSSLNSTSNKKRPAPPPPKIKPRQNFLKPSEPNNNECQNVESDNYPDELNPFAEPDTQTSTKTISTNHDILNPFAEYMTEENLNLNEKHVIKQSKRVAPKLPIKTPRVKTRNDEENTVKLNLSQNIVINASSDSPSDVNISEKIGKEINSSTPTNQDEDNKIVNSETNITLMENKIDSNTSSPVKNGSINSSSLFNVKSNDQTKEIKTESDSVSYEKSIDHSSNIDENSKIIEKLERISIDSDNQTSPSTNSFTPEKISRKKRPNIASKSQDSLSDSTSSKNSFQKPPAPARPLPPKREVRGDTSYNFIPYESLYSQLKELNEKQSYIEIEGRKLQNTLWEADQTNGQFEEILQEWLDLVDTKNDLYMKEAELHEILKRQELEDRHSDLEYELRMLMAKQESLKTAAEKAREEELILQILDTVNARAQLMEKIDESLNKSPTLERPKVKNKIKLGLFSIKRRSSSVGKIRTGRSKTFKFGMKPKKLETLTMY